MAITQARTPDGNIACAGRRQARSRTARFQCTRGCRQQASNCQQLSCKLLHLSAADKQLVSVIGATVASHSGALELQGSKRARRRRWPKLAQPSENSRRSLQFVGNVRFVGPLEPSPLDPLSVHEFRRGSVGAAPFGAAQTYPHGAASIQPSLGPSPYNATPGHTQGGAHYSLCDL